MGVKGFAGLFKRKKEEDRGNDSEKAPQEKTLVPGAAVDIGTTTLAACLYDLEDGTCLSEASAANPQALYGSDVISRIVFCERQFGNIRIIRNALIAEINTLLEKLCEAAGITTDMIMEVVCCGNTVMSHIFLGCDPASLAKAPFTPAYTGVVSRSAFEEGLKTSKNARLNVIPNIAGHVGGDITAGLIATELYDSKKTVLFVDIGTNGEIVLTGKKTYVCSAAAGPAFEGASVKCGMRSAPGAIRAVKADEKSGLKMETVPGSAPLGICGSGLLDLVSVFIDFGLIDSTGKILSASRRVRDGKDGKEILVLSENECREIYRRGTFDTDEKELSDIVITQKDIRELQLAKAAVRAGISTLLKKAGKTPSEVDNVILTGAFGCALDPKSAMNIGLIPEFEPEKIELCDDTALKGASEILLSGELMERAVKLPEEIEHVELADSEEFQKSFMKEINFDTKE